METGPWFGLMEVHMARSRVAPMYFQFLKNTSPIVYFTITCSVLILGVTPNPDGLMPGPDVKYASIQKQPFRTIIWENLKIQNLLPDASGHPQQPLHISYISMQ